MRLEAAFALRRGRFALDVELAVEAETLAVVGASGSGKSTLLALLCGLLAPDHGRLARDGEALLDTARGLSVPARARRIGLVSQRPDLFPHLTVGENLDVAERFAGEGAAPARAELVEALGILGLLGQRADRLSGGEAKRAQLARSLLNRPRLLLLDEPFAGLDEPLRHEVLGAILEARERTRVPLVLVTHRPSEAAALADAAVALGAGRVLAQGEPLDVLLRPDVLGPAHLAGLETILPAVVEGPHAARWGTLSLASDLPGLAAGSRVFFALGADDVLLARSAPETSARHVWPARVESLRAAGDDRLVTLRPSGSPGTLLARVSREAAEELALAPGAERTLLFKASSLRRLG